MNRNVVAALALASLGAVPAARQAAAPVAWNITDAVVAPGQTPTADAISLVRGIALRPDLAFRDGTIDFDLAAPGGGFAGVAFRVASAADYEIVYFSPSDDGSRWSTVQYQPVFEGETTWQLYRREGYYAKLPPSTGGAMHVHLAISGTRADVMLNGAADPVLRIRELKRTPDSGALGFWSSPTSTAPSRLTSLKATPGSHALAPSSPEHTPPGQLLAWRVSPRQPSPLGIAPPPAISADIAASVPGWTVVNAEDSGLVNLTRSLGNPAGRQRVNVFGGAGFGLAYAHVSLTSDRDRTTELSFSYSDGIGVYLDGRRLFAGRNEGDFRYDGYLGVVGNEADTVDLPLHRGENHLMLAVTDKAFGWGFRARLAPVDGVAVKP